jgi:hypothetical protein
MREVFYNAPIIARDSHSQRKSKRAQEAIGKPPPPGGANCEERDARQGVRAKGA